MNNIRAWGLAILVAGGTGFHPQETQAESFTGADFATWGTAAQDSFIETSVTMAGVVMTRVAPEKSVCINDWYFAAGQSTARNRSIRDTISKNQDYHPSGVILAVILDACGPLD
ncbi:MAG: hypothetical protein AAF674_22835 [Pseudomonadota bacterium]